MDAEGRSRIGTLGLALAGVQSRALTITLLVTVVVAIVIAATVVPALARPLGGRVGAPLALLILGALCWGIFVAAIGVIAILPPLLLPKRDRAVMAAHSWIGAREVRRLLGSAARATDLPTDPGSVNAWLAVNPATDRNRFFRVDALLLAGRLYDARVETELLPERSPLEVYRKVEARALLADQTGAPVDVQALRAGVASVPAGVDHTEAAVSLAVFLARRALPDGDWRAPLLEARPALPGSDLRLLVADFGLPMFEILFRKTVVPFTVLLTLIGMSVTVVPALLGNLP